ncbi:MAG: hypothetical protein ACTHKK_03165 [Candidatus Nitrosocosmicus sp.]
MNYKYLHFDIKETIKLSIMVLSVIALATGFVSIAHIRSVHAFSTDFSGLPRFDGNRLDFLKGPKK